MVKTLCSTFEFKCLIKLWLERLLEAQRVVSCTVVCLLAIWDNSPAVPLVFEVLFLRGLVVVVYLATLLLLFERDVAGLEFLNHIQGLLLILCSGVSLGH